MFACVTSLLMSLGWWVVGPLDFIVSLSPFRLDNCHVLMMEKDQTLELFLTSHLVFPVV